METDAQNSELPVAPVPREERIQRICELMAAGHWQRGRKTLRRVAKELGVAAITLRDDAITASMILKKAVDDDHMVALIEMHSQRIAEEALRMEEPAAAVSAYRLILEGRGVLKQKHEHRVELSGMSDDEVTDQAIDELIRDDRVRERVRAALRAWDENHSFVTTGQAIGPAMLPSSRENTR